MIQTQLLLDDSMLRWLSTDRRRAKNKSAALASRSESPLINCSLIIAWKAWRDRRPGFSPISYPNPAPGREPTIALSPAKAFSDNHCNRNWSYRQRSLIAAPPASSFDLSQMCPRLLQGGCFELRLRERYLCQAKSFCIFRTKRTPCASPSPQVR